MKKNLAVIVPMYNEAKGAERCVRALCQVIQEKCPESQLFVVNDGSRDKTPEILDRLTKEFSSLTVIHAKKNGGYGGALLLGAQKASEAGFEFGLFMDSDLTNDPKLIPVFAEQTKTDKYDLIKASRYVSGGAVKGVSWQRQILSVAGNLLAARLFDVGIRDCTNGFRAVRLSLVVKEKFSERGFPVIMEEMYKLKRKGARMKEIPYTLTARSGEDKQSSFSYDWVLFRKYLGYALRAALVPRTKLVVKGESHEPQP